MAVKRVSSSSRSQSASASAAAAAAAATASATPLSLSAEHELILMEALLAHKPAGMHKHFRWEHSHLLSLNIQYIRSTMITVQNLNVTKVVCLLTTLKFLNFTFLPRCFRMAVILETVNGALSEDLGAAATPVTSQQVRVLSDNEHVNAKSIL